MRVAWGLSIDSEATSADDDSTRSRTLLPTMHPRPGSTWFAGNAASQVKFSLGGDKHTHQWSSSGYLPPVTRFRGRCFHTKSLDSRFRGNDEASAEPEPSKTRGYDGASADLVPAEAGE